MKSAEKCSVAERLDKLRLSLQSSWAEIGVRLDLSESMIYQVKSGKKEMSLKALYRLARAEVEAGLVTENELREREQAAVEKARGGFQRRTEMDSAVVREDPPRMVQEQSIGVSAAAVRRWIKAMRALADDMEAELRK